MADHYVPLTLTAAEREALLKELAPAGVEFPGTVPVPTAKSSMAKTVPLTRWTISNRPTHD